MQLPDDDKRLRESFDHLRRTEQAAVPPFRRIWNAAHQQSMAGSRRRLRPGFAVGALALVMVSALIVGRLRVRERHAVAITASIATSNWMSPTDFLLHTPGRELGNSIPSFAHVPDYSPLTTRKETR